MPRGSRRRSNSRERRSHDAAIPQLPWIRRFKNNYPPMEPLSADQLEAIHDASMRILEEEGIEVTDDRARGLYKTAGATVDDSKHMVKMDRGLVAELLTTVPESFTLTPRNPDHALVIGGNDIHFGLVSGPPNIHDRIGGRRAGNFDDYVKLVKFAQYFNAIHIQGNQATAPTNLPANNRHMDTSRANVVYTDKAFSHLVIGPGRALDSCEIMARSRGMTLEEMAESPGSIGNINVNSPRKLDEHMASGLMQMAELNQATICTPFTLMGAMTPVSMAAALAQQNAEALFSICLTQLVRKGAPAVYGGFTSNVDMRSGAPAFGTPENAKANLAGGQLARRYKIPYRTSACNASNTVDAQSTYESLMALWGAVMGHGNIVYHAAGWLEGGLVASFEKLVVDVEVIQHVMGMLSPIEVNEGELGLEAIRDIAPGGHFFGTEHTMSRYETAFYQPFLSDWTNNEAWRDAGAKDATMRATELWQKALEEYEQPELDPARLESIDEYIAKRKEEIGDGEP